MIGVKPKEGNQNHDNPVMAIKKVHGSIEDKKGYVPGGYLIGNSNTRKLHAPGCRAIKMMNRTHIVPTDGAHFVPCKWCYAMDSSGTTNLDRFKADVLGTEVCMDPKINAIFDKVGCLTCGSKHGIVKMHPDDNGVRLVKEEGKWWIYFECDCGYQTALWKAQNKLKSMKTIGEI